MSDILLKASSRQPGKSEAKALRRDGNVPGVYYAKDQDPIHFTVPRLSLRDVVYTAEAKVVNLEVEGLGKKAAILKDVSFDPITDDILHVDLLGISAGQMITVEIPLHLTGSSVGVRNGGVLEQVMMKAHVKVDPTKMPEHIDVDVTELDINSAIHIGDLKTEGVEFEDREEAVIVTCVPPKVADATDEAAVEGAEEGAAAEGGEEGAAEGGEE